MTALVERAGRWAVFGALGAAVLFAWTYTVTMAGHAPSGTGMAASMDWTGAHARTIFVMWLLMMVAMMLPSALAMVLTMDKVQARLGGASAGLATGLFAAGYVLVWLGFSLLATLVQWGLERAGLLTGDGALKSAGIAAAAFVLAGAYQFMPIKRTCLDNCRSPLAFIARYWRPGNYGALAMGLRHGMFCLGCCWLLMLLLFVGGMMNLLWIIPLAVFVLIEKCAPGGRFTRQAAGLALILWGAAGLLVAA